MVFTGKNFALDFEARVNATPQRRDHALSRADIVEQGIVLVPLLRQFGSFVGWALLEVVAGGGEQRPVQTTRRRWRTLLCVRPVGVSIAWVPAGRAPRRPAGTVAVRLIVGTEAAGV